MLQQFHFIIVILARQSLDLAEKCLNSVLWQVSPYKPSVIYVDDASNYDLNHKARLKAMVEKLEGRLIFSSTRNYQIGSLDLCIPMISDKNSIVCLLDGDDYLMPDALIHVARAYSDPNIIMSYGNVLLDFRPYQNCQANYFSDKANVNTAYPNQVWNERNFRQNGFRCFHLRTFRRWLWDYINPNSFRRKNGEYFHASGDSSFLFPMLELLGDSKHVAFIKEPIYVYRLYEGNVHNYDKKSQFDDLEYIRFSQTPYPQLDKKLIQKHIEETQCVESQVSFVKQ